MIKLFKKIIKRFFKIIGLIKPIRTNETTLNSKFDGTIQIGNVDLIDIGERVSFGGEVILYANAKIEIGDDTMVAYHVIFHTSTHDYNDHPMWSKRIDKPIKVGKHVWIGTGAIILPGVIISDYSVIGAGSVVTSNIPEGAIVGGNPARIIRLRPKSTYLKNQLIFQRSEAELVSQTYNKHNCKTKLT